MSLKVIHKTCCTLEQKHKSDRLLQVTFGKTCTSSKTPCSRAQSSIEFMILASILLIIIAIVIATFIQPTTRIESTTNTLSDQYWASADIAIKAHVVNTTHAQLRIQNNLANNVTLQVAQVDIFETEPQQALEPGQRTTVTIPLVYDAFEQPSPYSYDVTFIYTIANINVTLFGQQPIIGYVQ